jgi:hypothetical protein
MCHPFFGRDSWARVSSVDSNGRGFAQVRRRRRTIRNPAYPAHPSSRRASALGMPGPSRTRGRRGGSLGKTDPARQPPPGDRPERQPDRIMLRGHGGSMTGRDEIRVRSPATDLSQAPCSSTQKSPSMMATMGDSRNTGDCDTAGLSRVQLVPRNYSEKGRW